MYGHPHHLFQTPSYPVVVGSIVNYRNSSLCLVAPPTSYLSRCDAALMIFYDLKALRDGGLVASLCTLHT